MRGKIELFLEHGEILMKYMLKKTKTTIIGCSAQMGWILGEIH
jgi:hypothetical protein